MAESKEGSLFPLCEDQQGFFHKRRLIRDKPERDPRVTSLTPPIKESIEGNLPTDGTNNISDLCASAQSDGKQMTHSGTTQYLLRLTGWQAGLL